VGGMRAEQFAVIRVCITSLTFHLCYPVSCLIALAADCELSRCLLLRWTALAADKADKRTHQNEPHDKTCCAFHIDLGKMINIFRET
jgi:hypothetical protein